MIAFIRYRFFLFAGLLPYFLGQVLSFHTTGSFNWNYFAIGLIGIMLCLVGVELFNEYFDAKSGGDRVFLLTPNTVPRHFFPLGLLVLGLAFLVGLYFTFKVGWLILMFSIVGFLAAYFYVGPPVRWAYRGLGELVIALSYGPFMILASYYLQTRRLDFTPFWVSLACGLSLFILALVNEIPDYYQDKLIGKRNLVVRLGKPKAIVLLLLAVILLLFLIGIGVVLQQLPLVCLVVFLLVPSIRLNLNRIRRNYNDPRTFLGAVNIFIITYLVIMFSAGVGFW